MLHSSGLVTAGIRTAVPYAVGAIASLFALAGVELPEEATVALASTITLGIGTLYYAVVRLVGKKFPQVEWLLGSPSKPEYK